jgi:hypothetical protein
VGGIRFRQQNPDENQAPDLTLPGYEEYGVMVNGDNPKIIFSTAEAYFSLPETIFDWIWDK